MDVATKGGFAAFEAELLRLVAQFERDRPTYLRTNYSEYSLRLEYLDKLFRSLGWDVDNAAGVAPHLREVIIENRTDENDRVKKADYVFFVNGIPKFVVEAKNPRESVDKAAFQAQNYAFNLRLFVGLATNFSDLRLYVVPAKPDKESPFPPAPGWRLYHREYEAAAKSIWDLLARDNVANGSIERFLQGLEKVPGRTAKQAWLIKPDRTKTVDHEFLSYLERERERLAKYLVQDNPQTRWGEHGLNEAVQRIIDRILFQRVCQDRNIDTFQKLETSLQEWRDGRSVKNGLWRLLVNNFRSMAGAFNGGLYGRRSDPPHPIDGLSVRDRWLEDFVEELSAEDSSYLFSTLPVEILGSVYERFLGSVVQPNGTVTQKPEVRKSGGVYYTPQYVVNDIVAKTIDPVLAGKTPRQITALRFLDPACGSGSFLIRVFERICEYHVEWFMAHPDEQSRQTCYRDPLTKDLRLTTAFKRKILLNNVYGIDIDEQAVEVTQLSLYLKLLENETRETLKRQLDLLSDEPLLPDLRNNIIVANALMDEDCTKLLAEDFDVAALKPLYRTGPFAASGGGFHAVVGNPPYDVLEKDRLKASWPHDAFRAYIDRSDAYGPALGGKLNLYRFFVVRSLSFLRNGGRYGMIVPLSLLADISCAATRRHLFRNGRDVEAHCFPQKDDPNRRIFFGAKLSTAVVSCEKAPPRRADSAIKLRVYPANSFDDTARAAELRLADLDALDPKNTPVPLVGAGEWEILRRVHTGARVVPLGKVDGIQITRGEINQTIYRRFITSNPKHTRLVKGVEIGPYRINERLSQGEREWFNQAAFLKEHEARPVTRLRRIATQRITGIDERRRVVAAIVEPLAYFADSTNSVVVAEGSPYSLEYILGLLNSTFIQWRFRATSTNNNVGTNELEGLPFRLIDFGDRRDAALYKRVVVAVRHLLKLSGLSGSGSAADQRRYGALAGRMAAEIDGCVEELFGLDVFPEQPWRSWNRAPGRRRSAPMAQDAD